MIHRDLFQTYADVRNSYCLDNERRKRESVSGLGAKVWGLGIFGVTLMGMALSSHAVVSGDLVFLDASGAVTTTYQGSDAALVVQVSDLDRNEDAGNVDEFTVLLTSDTENTGTLA